MKQILTKLSLFLLLVSGLTMVSSAQAVATPGTATISSDMVIQIDPAATLMENTHSPLQPFRLPVKRLLPVFSA